MGIHSSKKLFLLIVSTITMLIIGSFVTFAYKAEYFEGNLFTFFKTKQPALQLAAPPHQENLENKSSFSPKVNLQIKPKIQKTQIPTFTTEQKLEAANIFVMTIPENDSMRSSNTGNVDMGQFIENFYQSHEDDFDMLIAIAYDSDDAHGRGNGISDGFFIKDVPANIGKSNYCMTSIGTDCMLYPAKLKYIQQLVFWNYTYDTFPTFTALHEIGHYWGVDWHQAGNDQCYTDLGMAWVNQLLENGHWTERFQAGNTSTLTYPTNFLEDRDPNNPLTVSTVWEGQWTDNHNGTFTKNGVFFNARREGLKFNNVDLYAMGLMNAQEIAEEEMFLVLDPELISADPSTAIATYSGTRMDLTLDDIQNLLRVRGTCEGIGPNYYYTGNGDRDMQGRSEFSDNMHIGFVLIQYLDNKITEDHAYHLCKIVNEEITHQWHNATKERSTLSVYLSTNTKTPDCEALFPEAAANYTPIDELYPDDNDNNVDPEDNSDDDSDALEILR